MSRSNYSDFDDGGMPDHWSNSYTLGDYYESRILELSKEVEQLKTENETLQKGIICLNQEIKNLKLKNDLVYSEVVEIDEVTNNATLYCRDRKNISIDRVLREKPIIISLDLLRRLYPTGKGE